MSRMLVTFLPIAALLTVTPGVATVLVIHRAAVSGRRAAFATTVGNEAGVIVWSLAAGLGLAAIVAASAAMFEVVKLVGAVALVVLGLAALRGRASSPARRPVESRGAFRDGILTAIANPKLVAFYVALFPQFVPAGTPVLAASCFMGALLVLLDLVWYSLLAAVVARAAGAFLRRWARRAERICGVALVALGLRLAYEQR